MRKSILKIYKALTLLALLTVASPNLILASPTPEPQAIPESAQEQTAPVPISLFERDDCAHCIEENAFLTKLEQERNDIEVHHYNLKNQYDRDLWEQLAELEKIPKVTPITLVGNTIIEGFLDEETTGQRIIQLVEESKGKETLKFEEYIAAGGTGKVEKVEGTCDSEGLEPCEVTDNSSEYTVKLPIIGTKIDLRKYSLPVLSAILGFIDGFNPCAMWVLVTFLIVLIDAGSKKKMWQLAGLFIAAETIMYYLILNVWYTAWDFIGLNEIITPIVGTIAVAAGLFFLYEWKNSDGTCKVGSLSHKRKTSNKIRKLVESEFTLLSIIAVLGIAFSVNIIEFACSIGIPQTFTKVIELNNLDFWTTQFYMVIYIIMYMVDDFIVFGLALYSFEKIGMTTKYTKLSHLIGGTLMIILGLILLIDPKILVLQ